MTILRTKDAKAANDEVRERVGKVLANCFERMLRTDVWAYSQSKSYWGRTPWAPDPCYRENVMYTGHLLHLLALYELLQRFRGVPISISALSPFAWCLAGLATEDVGEIGRIAVAGPPGDFG